ncbi:MAG: hypothetical protein GY720_20615 [bacterium]|nr:hypothetical protein [bacterium]
MKRVIPFLIVIALVVGSCGSDSESTAPTTTVPSAIQKPTGTDALLSSHLFTAATLAADGMALDVIAGRVPELQFDGDQILIEVTYDEVTAERVAAAEAAGLVVSGQYPDLLMITGAASAEDLRALAALDGVASIVPAFGATTGS